MSDIVNVVIAIGGTGARCAEAIAHIAAAGGYGNSVRMLLVDLDQGNGNLDRAQRVVSRYQALHKAAAGGSLFLSEISLDVWKPSKDLRLTEDASLSFSSFLGRDHVSREVGHFLDLFFAPSLYAFDMTGGCFQHPEIGAIVLRRALRQSLDEEEGALRRCLDQIANDLKGGREVRILVVGSVFGGTGASGLPFLPNLIRKELPNRWQVLSERADHLRMGGVFLAPYFQWSGHPEGQEAVGGPNSNRLSPHAKAVLQHYAKHPPGYNAAYILGAPHLFESGVYASRGNRQVNKAHYIELTAALAAQDFFRRDLEPGTSFLYAESTEGGEEGNRRQIGVNWKSLPNGTSVQDRLLHMTLTAVFLESYILPGLRAGDFVNYPWFRDTVGGKLTAAEDDLLTGAVQGYRRWLCQILESISASAAGKDHPSLLPLQADQLGSLGDADISGRQEDLPGLLLRGKGHNADFNEICARMDRIPAREVKDKDGGNTAMGRLVLTVDRAVSGALSTKSAQKAIGQWSFGDPTGKDEQSRYLPQVTWEPDVHQRPGEFWPGDDLFLRIANGLVVGQTDIGNSNPISSPWASTYLFETALSNGNPATRDAALKTWRGLLGIIAFRRHLGGGQALTAERLDLEVEARRFGPALAEFVQEAYSRNNGRDPRLAQEAARQWLTFYTLSLAGEPIGGTSPLTLFFPAQDLGRSAALLSLIPWFDSRNRVLGDPAEYFGRHAALQVYNRSLKSWLDHLLRSGILAEKARQQAASNLVLSEIQRWAQSDVLVQAGPEPNLVFDAGDQTFGDFSLPAIPIQ